MSTNEYTIPFTMQWGPTEMFPLELRGDGWSVGFRSKPSPAVKVCGRAPTSAEFYGILATCNINPFLLAECLLIAAQAAEVQERV